MSLVQVAKESRILLKVGGAIGAIALIVFLAIKGGSFIQDTYFKKPIPPEMKFGALPPLEFPLSNSSIPDFSIETDSGFLPTFPLTINVYSLEKNEPTITALPDARNRAVGLGFTDNEQEISPSQYKWTQPIQNTSLLYDIYSLNFSVSPNYSIYPSFLPITTLQKESIFSNISDFVISLGGNTEDIKFENAKFTYYSVDANGIIPVTDPSVATLARVDLFQNPVNNLKIYYPSPNNSVLYFTVASLNTMNVVDASFHHFTPNLDDSSTYPLKTAQEALDDLKNGKGFIISPTSENNVDITDVSLGYYLDNSETQKYLQPIVVFVGKKGFQAFVSAVKD